MDYIRRRRATAKSMIKGMAEAMSDGMLTDISEGAPGGISRGIAIPLVGLEEATVVSRPNRFVAMVEYKGEVVASHVADSGRLRELIYPGNVVLIRRASGGTCRKTDYDLVLARHSFGGARGVDPGEASGVDPGTASGGALGGDRGGALGGESLWVSVDTRYPTRVFGEALRQRVLKEIREYADVLPEYWFHNLPTRNTPESGRPEQASKSVRSRMDFFLPGVGGSPHSLVEVKSVTLCVDGLGLFPDAPTERGTRHLMELSRAAKEGYRAFAVFVAQREDVERVAPNKETDPAFADALVQAQKMGVTLLAYRCRATRTEIRLDTCAIPVYPGGWPQ